MRVAEVAAAVRTVPVTPVARLAHMTAAFVVSDLARGAMGFVMSVAIARLLGTQVFGRWILYATWASTLIVLCDLGFGMLLTRDAARARRVGPLIAGALAGRLALFALVGLLLLGVLVIERVLLERLLPGANAHRLLPGTPLSHVLLIILLAGTGIAYGCFAPIYRATPRGLTIIVTIETLGAATQCLGAVLVMIGGGRLAELLALAALVQAAQLLAAIAMLGAIAPGDRLERPSARATWTLLQRAFPFALTGLVANAQARTGPLLLGAIGTTGDMALLGAVQRFDGLARRLPSAALGAAFPVLASEAQRGAARVVQERFDGAFRWFAVLAAVAIGTAAPLLLRVSYGEAFASAAPALMWAAAGLVPSLINAGRKVSLYAHGEERTVLRWSTVALALQIAGCVTLAHGVGATGVMCAIAVAEAAIWWPLRSAQDRVRCMSSKSTTPSIPA
jgi:O-antigen/teichoic acid export membrane protein